MAQITVRAAARVLGLNLDQAATFEETPLLRSLIESGKLVDLTEAAEPDDEAAQALDDSGQRAEVVARTHHPAGRRRGASSPGLETAGDG